MRRIGTLLVLCALTACDSGSATGAGLDASPTPDAAVDDAGATDAGELDGGPPDGARRDGGPTDGGAADAGPADAGVADAATGDAAAGDGGRDGGAPFCELPATAPFTSAGPFENVAITWDGAACGATSDGADAAALIVFTNVEGLTGQSFGGWTLDAATGGTILGDNVLDGIPPDTPVAVTLSQGDVTIELTFTLTSSTLSLDAFDVR